MADHKLKLLDVNPSEFTGSKLPSNSDVISAIYSCKEVQENSFSESIKIVTNQIIDIWQRSCIPTLCNDKSQIETKVSRLFDKYYALLKQNVKSSSVNKFKVI